MLVTSEPNSGPSSRTPSILDSPTLARVERARLRQEASNGHREDSLERCLLDPKQSLLIGRIPVGQMTGPIKRGLLWQQRDRLFSRWKERYFILTRDYLNCFKRASGSASEKISDMGQFIFKIKLVDVEKVEWLNRRSYSAIGLLLGREGRVLLRSEHGLEDWFELLEECTLSSKERRRALRLTQGPRSRASLAAPVSHSSLQSNHLGLGGTYSGAIEDWLLSRHHKNSASHHHHYMHSDSVPDLSVITENGLMNGMLTNQSTPKKVPNARHNFSGSSNGYGSHNGSFQNGYPYSPLKKLSDNYLNGNDYSINDEDEEVELRRGGRYRDNDELYRRPLGPTSNDNHRHSLLTDIDISACDSGLDTPPSTHRPSSYRDNMYCVSAYHKNQSMNKDKTTDTGISSSRGTLVSPGNSFRYNNNNIHSYGSRYSVQEQKILKSRNEDNKNSMRSIKTEFYEQNKYNNNGNSNGNINLNSLNGNGTSAFRDRYQHPALAAIISESQGMKFRDRSYSDCQQVPRRQWNNNTPSPKRIPFLGTPPTRV